MIPDINSEERLVQKTFGTADTLGRTDARDAALTRELRAALRRLNQELPYVKGLIRQSLEKQLRNGNA